jgi:hypothetical protein
VFGFEFMDLAWLPDSLKETLREVLDCALSKPFRSYYDIVVEQISDRVSGDPGITAIAELGAGTGPLTARLAADPKRPPRLKLILCDLYPHLQAFQDLQAHYPDTVRPVWEPVDFSRTVNFPAGTYVVVSAAFHHVPPNARRSALGVLSAFQGMIVEPIHKKFVPICLAWIIIFPALATPFLLLGRRSGTVRRFFWCYIVPLAPLMIVWDAVISCLRCWARSEWAEAIASDTRLQRFSFDETNEYAKVEF